MIDPAKREFNPPLSQVKTVVDQNCLGRPELRAYLEASKENEAVVTDMAIFEMLKGSDPTWGAKRRLEIASDFPDQVFCTAGTGELMRREITSHTCYNNHRRRTHGPLSPLAATGGRLPCRPHP